MSTFVDLLRHQLTFRLSTLIVSVLGKEVGRELSICMFYYDNALIDQRHPCLRVSESPVAGTELS